MNRLQLNLIAPDRILVFDGAMGTMLHAKGVPVGQCFDEANISQPDLVEEIHLAYLEAGADILETNTFGANRLKLDSYGLGRKTREINIAAASIARRCAGGKALVAGSVGPTGKLMEPLGPLDFSTAVEAYREQIVALCEGGVDLLVIETMQDLREAKAALHAARMVTEVPVICQMSFSQEGRSMMGTPPGVAAVVLNAFGTGLVGTNCGTGPQDMLTAVREMAQTIGTGLVAQPNAGLPTFYEGRLIYLSTPDYVADFSRLFVEAGAVLVGGCCGTTPDHIRAIKAAVGDMIPARRSTDSITRIVSRTRLVEIGAGKPIIAGNRLTGGTESAGASADHVQIEVEQQFRQGAEVVVLDCDLADRACRLVEVAQSASQAALCIVGSDIRKLEETLCSVEGRAIVMMRGSVNAVLDQLLPVAKRHGAAVLVRIDENGAVTPEDKLRIAHRVVGAAESLRMERSSVMVHLGDLHGVDGSLDEAAFAAVELIKNDIRLGVAVDHCPSLKGDRMIRQTLSAGADLVFTDPACLASTDLLS